MYGQPLRTYAVILSLYDKLAYHTRVVVKVEKAPFEEMQKTTV